jgi:hypothetical protein
VASKETLVIQYAGPCAWLSTRPLRGVEETRHLFVTSALDEGQLSAKAIQQLHKNGI